MMICITGDTHGPFGRKRWGSIDLNGKRTIVMGGAYSIDKMLRLAYGYGW